MSTREMAHKILDSMNEEQLIGFISLFKVFIYLEEFCQILDILYFYEEIKL